MLMFSSQYLPGLAREHANNCWLSLHTKYRNQFCSYLAINQRNELFGKMMAPDEKSGDHSSLGPIWEPWMSVQHFMQLHETNVKLSENFILLVDLKGSQRTKVIYPQWTLNICSKFHGNPSNSCEDISLWTASVNLTVALREKSEGQ